MDLVRRQWLVGICSIGGGVALLGCNKLGKLQSAKNREESLLPDKGGALEVTAAEDLMREHGVMRRALLVYQEMAAKLRGNSLSGSSDALLKTAKLFRAFGEEYHEKKLEEAYIFPAVKSAGGPASLYADVLIAQHQRGREITDYIMAVSSSAKVASGNIEPLARALESFVRMYEHHAAMEDTVIFPAWKQTLSDDQADELNDKFEEIEQQQFGADGFEDAVKQMSDIETALGLADLAQFTAPAPPQV